MPMGWRWDSACLLGAMTHLRQVSMLLKVVEDACIGTYIQCHHRAAFG